MSTSKSDCIRRMKGRERVAVLTAYDFPTAKMLDSAQIPVILVGDSVGMVVLGYPDTTHVTMEEMEHHVRAVARAKPQGLIVADLPYQSYTDAQTAVRNAQRLVSAGAEAVKAEGGCSILPQVRAIVAAGIPFVGHLGMLPQSVLVEGGYHVKGKVESERLALLEDARALSEAGAFAIVLELVTAAVARDITQAVPVPTIGIGAGSGCDGEVLVITDLLGTSGDYVPKHVKQCHHFGKQMRMAVVEWKNGVTTSRPEA